MDGRGLIFSFAVLCLGFALMQPTEGADRLASGTVIDEKTKSPLSGAYVMAVYRHPDSLGGDPWIVMNGAVATITSAFPSENSRAVGSAMEGRHQIVQHFTRK